MCSNESKKSLFHCIYGQFWSLVWRLGLRKNGLHYYKFTPIYRFTTEILYYERVFVGFDRYLPTYSPSCLIFESTKPTYHQHLRALRALRLLALGRRPYSTYEPRHEPTARLRTSSTAKSHLQQLPRQNRAHEHTYVHYARVHDTYKPTTHVRAQPAL